MLVFLYYYKREVPKTSFFEELEKALGENMSKPVKAEGTRWIAHHYNALKILLKHCGAYMTHHGLLNKLY